MRNLQAGFTLIELMIVIAIIAILAAILIPNFLHARAESQTSSCEGNLKQLATALEEYAVDNSGKYPASFANLIAANKGVYLKVVPGDPAGGNYGLTVPAVAPCTMTQANTYYITDGDAHDTTTTLTLLNNPGGKGIGYCSGSGILGLP